MDGIDGLAAAETITISLGLALLVWVKDAPADLAAPALAVCGAALAFLLWNRHPARVFLGDVGSVPLGYLIGWLLLWAALEGYWAVAVILPLYYWSDAGLTLLRRLLRGERIWQAHREHYYQRALRSGITHGRVVAEIAVCNFALIAFALLADREAWRMTALALALLAVLVLLFRLRWLARL